MASIVMIRAGPASGCLHGCLVSASAAGSGAPASRGLAIATLISWLCAEILGACMLRSWIASGGARRRQRRPDSVSLPVLLGHAGLALAGLMCWVSFLVSGWGALAWLAIGFLAPAIGLGISTVTVWTPYPARRPVAGGRRPGSVFTVETLDRVLADEALTSKLVDDLLAQMLARPAPARGPKWQPAPLVPILHGLLAITTFLLATLAAIATLTN